MEKSNIIPPNKHVFVCGMTGTGKSYLCEKYLTNYDYVVKLDTKDETDERYSLGLSPWENLEEGKDFTVVREFEELDEVETKKIIFVPDYEKQTTEDFEKFFKWIFNRGNTILWIDELMSIGTVNSFPKQLGRLYTQGRSKGIGVWSCSQRPSAIPSIAMANSNYFFVFNMTLPQDRKKLVETTGQLQMYDLPKGHNFWYYKMGDNNTVKAKLVV